MDGFNHYVPPTTRITLQSDKKYHVFLSFRGKDVRNTFVNRLYEALSAAGLLVYLDSKELKKGEIIDESLKAAIGSSAICIPIFSKGYASSAWCLREATCMLKSTGLIIPLFYDVEPADVRHSQRDSSPYKDCFAKHEKKGRYEGDEIAQWKQSLYEICRRSGWSMELTAGSDEQLVKSVTFDVINSLDKIPLDVAKHPVGLEDRKQDLIQRLDLISVNNVIKLGIWGLGGIGKTTLAKAVYNEVYRRFAGYSFLSNVRSTAESASGLMALQLRILKDLVRYDGEVRCVDEGKALLRERLRGVRALVILDDVNSLEQLEALLGDWMAAGSRVLLTSRDRHVFNLAQISDQFIYQMRAFLYDKKNENDIGCWNETLLNIVGQDKIFETLQISYSALSDEEKEIFLDTACFFKGEKIPHSIIFWKSMGYKKVNSAIINLSMKLLLKIDDEGVFDMHDHLQDMGREIVERRFRGDAYHERSRVWETANACNLRNQYMNISRLRLQGGYLPDTAVWNTPMLRLLHMDHSKIKSWTVKLTPDLIWLRLNCCSLASEEGGLSKWNRLFSPRWGPRFSFDGHGWQLRIMDLIGCRKLQRLPSSIGNLSKLRFLTVSKCLRLKNLPDSLGKLSQLESLEVSLCFSLENLPKTIGNLTQLESLNLSDCSKLKTIPDTFRNLTQLQSLNLSNCSKLKTIPDTFRNLTQLQSLHLSRCSNLKTIPDAVGNLTQLQCLGLSGCSNLNTLPDAVGNLTQLQFLDLSGCSNLNTLPDAVGNLTQLRSLVLSGCSNLNTLPDAVGNPTQLQSLDVIRLGALHQLDNLPRSCDIDAHIEAESL